MGDARQSKLRYPQDLGIRSGTTRGLNIFSLTSGGMPVPLSRSAGFRARLIALLMRGEDARGSRLEKSAMRQLEDQIAKGLPGRPSRPLLPSEDRGRSFRAMTQKPRQPGRG